MPLHTTTLQDWLSPASGRLSGEAWQSLLDLGDTAALPVAMECARRGDAVNLAALFEQIVRRGAGIQIVAVCLARPRDAGDGRPIAPTTQTKYRLLCLPVHKPRLMSDGRALLDDSLASGPTPQMKNQNGQSPGMLLGSEDRTVWDATWRSQLARKAAQDAVRGIDWLAPSACGVKP